MGDLGGGTGRLFESERTATGWSRRFSRAWKGQALAIRNEIDRELSRSRRYGGEVSVAWIEIESIATARALLEWRQFCARAAASLREWDTCWMHEDGLLLLFPHTSRESADRVTSRLVAMLDEIGIESQFGTVAFPSDAPTTDGLLLHLTNSISEHTA
jgi:hypothetical protein